MKVLEDAIRRHGRHLGDGILKVDTFLNHQVDPALMDACGKELARKLEWTEPDRVLTAEISGIGPALFTAHHLGVPLVFARKQRPVTMPGQVYLTLTPSHTKGNSVELIVSPEFLPKNDRVLIVDDFLATGHTIFGLMRLTNAAGANVVGFGTVIEKTFEGGRERLEPIGLPIESLAVIVEMVGERIVLAEEEE